MIYCEHCKKHEGVINIYELRDSYTDNYIGTAELHESCVESYEEVSDCVCI